MLRNFLRKEWRLLNTPIFIFSFFISMLSVAWFIASAIVEYSAIAAQLAKLKNRQGATEMLLGSINDFLQIIIMLWAIFFGARLFAQEKQWNTAELHFSMPLRAFFQSKMLILFTILISITIPYWITVIGLQTQWDWKLILSQFAAQVFFIVFSAALSLTVSSAQNQTISASLLTALIFLLFWLAPTLSTEPPTLVAVLRYLSPFEHFSLLQRGIFSVQSVIYLFTCSVLSAVLIPYFWQEKHD